jgi:hypothetical protein
MRCQFAAKPGQIESSIDLPHQMIFGNRVAKMKLVEQLTLATLQTAVVSLPIPPPPPLNPSVSNFSAQVQGSEVCLGSKATVWR